MADLRIALGRRLQELRENAKKTQEEIATKAGIEAKYLADIEHARKSVSLEVLQRLMDALDVEPFELFSFKLGAKGPTKSSADQLLRDAIRHPDASVRRLIATLVRDILQWHRKKK